MTLHEALNQQNSHAYFVNDKRNNRPIFCITIERIGNWELTNDSDLVFNEEKIEVNCHFYNIDYTDFLLHLDERVSKESLMYYIDKFDNIKSWYNDVYKIHCGPILKDELYQGVVDYIKHDIYLFCMTIDGTTAYEDNVTSIDWIIQ